VKRNGGQLKKREGAQTRRRKYEKEHVPPDLCFESIGLDQAKSLDLSVAFGGAPGSQKLLPYTKKRRCLYVKRTTDFMTKRNDEHEAVTRR